MSGSSPQVRGKQGSRRATQVRYRLIPAGAGKTLCSAFTRRPASAHPRRCGENSRTLSKGRIVLGSSPQVRGKLKDAIKRQNSSRLIPAGAGKTVNLVAYSFRPPAHPRRCGENAQPPCAQVNSHGSSPQVRGKPCIFSTHPVAHPAHPRRCGENMPAEVEVNPVCGSSPQVRGKLEVLR